MWQLQGLQKDSIPIYVQAVSLAIFIERVLRNGNDKSFINEYINNEEFNPKLIQILSNILEKI